MKKNQQFNIHSYLVKNYQNYIILHIKNSKKIRLKIINNQIDKKNFYL
jgi:hypothetical protein